jgi:hypothetical protein
MQRPIRLANWGLVTGLLLVLNSCGGGGGSSGGGSGQQGPEEPTATATVPPLRTVPSRNERTESSEAGTITLRLEDIIVAGGQTTRFTVLLADAQGAPAANKSIQIETGSALHIEPGYGLTLLSSNLAVGTTGPDGSLSGAVRGISGGTYALTARATEAPFDGLAVTLSIIVNAPRVTATGGSGPTPTPTALPCVDVQTIIVQTDTLNVSSQAGGRPLITAAVFNSDNQRVPQVNVLFDVQPRVASFDELTAITGSDGTAATHLNIPPNSSFGSLTVSVSACEQQGNVVVNVVSGVSTKPVATVVLQADPSTVGSLSGGDINLTAAILDADNAPINGIDVLFITEVGKVNPLIARSAVSGAQGGIASSSLQIPAGAINKEYGVSALAGGVSGSTTITVVPGRGGTNTGPRGVPPGSPASIQLGASPTRLQVAGTGGTELATLIGRVFDNNGNPLADVPVRYHVVAGQSAPGALVLPVTTPTPSGSPTPVVTTGCAADDPVSISDTAGFALIQLRSGSGPGPVTVAACADTIIDGAPSVIIEQQTVVGVTSGPVSRIALAMNPRAIDNSDGSQLTTLTALVTDAQGNVVEDGTPVFFEIVRSKVCIGGTNDGQACSGNGTCDGGSCVEDETDPSGNIAITGSSTTNAEPPCDTSQFVPQTGLPVVPQPGDAITCIKYPVDQQATEVWVRASAGGVFNNVAGQSLTLPGRLGDLEVSVNPPTVRVSDLSDSLALVNVAAFDDALRGVQNVRVRFTTNVGTIDKSVVTDENGEADATLTIPAGTASGTATLRAAGGGLLITNITVPIVNTGGGATPTPGSGTEPAAIQFVGAQPAQLGVRGSGLPEQSVLTFSVTDGLGEPVAGAAVNFSLARVADEHITPLQGITDENGEAQVTLTSGERALSVQVSAQVTTPGTVLVARSTAVNILGGPPSQPNFSVAAEFGNISGRVSFGLENRMTAFVADRFGNPVPPGTAVSFTTRGGAVGNPTVTDSLGQATATLVSQAPLTANGIVATLATTVGERPFVDMNGNGVCDDGEDQLVRVPEPYYDSNCNRVHDQGEDFIDLNDDGQFNEDQLPSGSSAPACADRIVVFDSICTTFSGSTSLFLLPSGSGPIEAGGGRDFTLIVSDNPNPIGNAGFGNPIVGGSTVSVTLNGTRGRLLGLDNFTLPDAQTNNLIIDGVNRFGFSVVDNAPDSTTAETDAVIVTVTSSPGSLPAGGNGSATVQSFITFLAAPTPTPTGTPLPPTATPNPTATPTSAPPAIAPPQVTLSVGAGAPPNACNGAGQTFVVTGGSPPFTVSAGGGCVSVTSVPTSGASFLYTAGNLVGAYSITVTDALGRSAAAGVTVQGPPTPTPTATPISTGTAGPQPTASITAPPGSIQFLGAVPAAIGVRGSGLPEQSLLTYRVNSTVGQPIPGVAVQFVLSGTGSETLNPATATSDENGLVTTAVTSGIQAASVRVTASLATNPGVFAQSTAVSILGAPPAVNHFSVAPAVRNIAGRVTYGIEDKISAFVNDRFGNAVPPGTAVSFITNAASVVSPTTTNASGVATATLLSEGLVPPTGIITVLAYTRGEESFLDNNGNGIFDAGDNVLPNSDNLPEPFIDFRPLPGADGACSQPAPSALCNNAFDVNTQFERFIDANGDQTWNTQGTAGAWDNNIFVFGTTVVTFSGPLVAPELVSCSLPPCNGFDVPNGGAISFTVNVHDDLVNPLVGGSTIAVNASAGDVSGGSITVPDAHSFNQLVPGLTQFTFVVQDPDSETLESTPSTITLSVSSQNGNGTFILASGVFH